MSLLNLLHKNVIIKFADSAKNQFNPAASYVFRLTGVDAMGFLHLQDLKPGSEGGHETTSEPYWINKDLVREIHELHLANVKETLHYHGYVAKPETPKSETTKPETAKSEAKAALDQVRRNVIPKNGKTKTSAKQKSVLN